MTYRLTEGARVGRTWPTILAPGTRTAAGDVVVDSGRQVRWVRSCSEGAGVGRSAALPGAASLAVVDAMVKHYRDVADPLSLRVARDTLLEGGWAPVVIVALSPNREMYVIAPDDVDLTIAMLTQATRTIGRAR